jgi:EAL domain-containing protein (putative c-di-GMP-specific phosphodiesterase class I)
VIVQRAADDLESQLRQGDVLARVGADQFMILLPGVDHETAGAIARRAMAALSRETMVAGETPVRLSACIGLVPFDGQDDAQTVIRRTCAALEEAKSVAPATLLVFNDALEARARTSIRRREHLIREALDHDRIELDFQPILDIQGGTVKHYEALLRLRGADGVRVSLSEFLPDAERFGLIRALDYRVLELTAARLVALERAGRAVSFSVNLSGVHFGTPALRQRVRSILNERRFDPRRLVFEVTETAALRDLEQAGRFIAELKEFGCQFALDDFGVGYASFYYLKGLPVDYIKIDGAFVRDLATAASDRLFVKAMVDVARGLGVKTIAEFVNDGRTLDLLKTYGVDYAQGFYIGRPGPLPAREA